ncbi:MAG: hypothetical protein NDJ89_17605 [Oligoflexia bacterium]|nr:hypothetical protein [Oligoflexia bacterium]
MNWLRLNRTELRLFGLLLLGCVIGSIAVVPYALALRHNEQGMSASILLLSALNALILYPVPIYVGILAKRTSSLAGAPLLEHGQTVVLRKNWSKAVIAGCVAGLLVIMGDKLFAMAEPTLAALNAKSPSRAAGFFASFYGGVVEEVLMRFFLVGLLARMLRSFDKAGIWVAIIM